MSNRPVLFLWVYIKVKGKRHIRLAFFIPLVVLAMLVDEADDLLSFINLLSFGRVARGKCGSAFDWVRLAKSVVREIIFKTGPVKLADISANSAKSGRVRVLCSLI